MPEDEVPGFARELAAPLDLVTATRRAGRLPVVNFAAGGHFHARRRGVDDGAGL